MTINPDKIPSPVPKLKAQHKVWGMGCGLSSGAELFVQHTLTDPEVSGRTQVGQGGPSQKQTNTLHSEHLSPQAPVPHHTM